MADIPNQDKVVAVAMSGGVDSSVAALLIKRAGYRAIGLTMKLWSPPPPVVTSCETGTVDKTCCTVDSALDAKRVCDQIGIPHFTLDMQEDFENLVIQPFYESYLNAQTPNPCVNCNSYVKWDALWKRARAIGAHKMATGHYAMTETREDKTFILRGMDKSKDQSYFLWGIPPENLRATLFPLENLSKKEVRQLASDAGLKTANKGESQDICFIPNGNYRKFVEARSQGRGESLPFGNTVDTEGKTLARHQGLANYTIGQRRGLGVATGEPVYVKKLDRGTNTLILGRKEELYATRFRANGVNFFETAGKERECLVQFRYRSSAKSAVLRFEADGWVEVELKEPGYCVTPGQSAVFYDGDRLLGGARIQEVF